MHWIRVVYLYLFSLLGLVLVVIGSAQLVNLALRTYVLTEADAELRWQHVPEPPMRAMAPERARQMADDSVTPLEPEEREALRSWAAEYERTREQREAVDPVRSRRQRDAAGALGLLLVGLPLYLYHWRTIRRERGPRAEPA